MNPPSIDGSLYQFHIDIQLRLLENDATILTSKKETLRKILQSLKQVDGNALYPIFNDIFHNSIDHRFADNQADAKFSEQVDNNENVDPAIAEPQSEPQAQRKQTLRTSKRIKGKNKQIKEPAPAKNKGKQKSK
ncbi:hypothetical protein BD408DRAFT_445194 [Parasitella parasitica]|nr:hypothetical protein BD408DRAFT_445194 [Parasitella parasitica]